MAATRAARPIGEATLGAAPSAAERLMFRDSNAARMVDNLDRALGHAIRLRRRALDLSQHQLASACGISFQQVQKYENGANRVSFSRLVRIAQALDCRVTDLISALDQPTTSPADLEFLKLAALPGGLDLLKRYEALAEPSRRLLVDLLASLEEARAERAV